MRHPHPQPLCMDLTSACLPWCNEPPPLPILASTRLVDAESDANSLRLGFPFAKGTIPQLGALFQSHRLPSELLVPKGISMDNLKEHFISVLGERGILTRRESLMVSLRQEQPPIPISSTATSSPRTKDQQMFCRYTECIQVCHVSALDAAQMQQYSSGRRRVRALRISRRSYPLPRPTSRYPLASPAPLAQTRGRWRPRLCCCAKLLLFALRRYFARCSSS